jgi:CheY-like chemotaxis protein
VLARELSRTLGGDLELVTTRPMQGSRFRLSLDVERRADQPSPAAGVMSQPELSGLSVLFAEDNADILESYSLLLESVGCRVERCTNGLEAVNRLESQTFDVVLMDMQMPVLSGLEATRRIRARGFTGPVIALSAHAMIEDWQQFLDAGCDDHILKPIDFDRLVTRLTEYRSQR